MFLIAVILLSIIIGYIRKGNLANVVKAEIRVPYLFVLALLLFVAVEAGNAAGWEIIVNNSIWIRFLAHFTLITSIFVNIQTLDIWPLSILIGSVMNFTAIFSNVGRMPVSLKALEIAGIEKSVIEASSYFEIAGASTSFSFLGGIIPIPLPGIFAQVISVGTLLIAFGAFGFIQELMMGIEYVSEDDAENPDIAESLGIQDSVPSSKPVEAPAADISVGSSEEEDDAQIKAAILGAVAENAQVSSEDDSEYDDIDDYDDYDGYFDEDDAEYEDEKFGDLFREVDEQLAGIGVIEEPEEEHADTYEVYEDEPAGAPENSLTEATEAVVMPEENPDVPAEVSDDKDVSSQEEPIDMLLDRLSEDDEDEFIDEADDFEYEFDIELEDIDADELFDGGLQTDEPVYDTQVPCEPGDADVCEEESADISSAVFEQTEESGDDSGQSGEECSSVVEESSDTVVTEEVLCEDVEKYDSTHAYEETECDEPGEAAEAYLNEECPVDEDDAVTHEDQSGSISDDGDGIIQTEPEDMPDALSEAFIEDETDMPEDEQVQEDESVSDDAGMDDMQDSDSDAEAELIIEGLDEYEDICSILDIDDYSGEDEVTAGDEVCAEAPQEDVSSADEEAEEDMQSEDPACASEEFILTEPEIISGEQINAGAEYSDTADEEYEEDEELEAIFRAIRGIDEDDFCTGIITADSDDFVLDDVVTLEYANAASFFEDLDRNEVPADEADFFENIFADDSADVSAQVENALELIKADDESANSPVEEISAEEDEADAFEALRAVGKTVDGISNELIIEPQTESGSVLPQTDSQYIVIDGKIVENPNYKLRRSSRTRFATEEEKLFGDITSGRRRSKSAGKGKFSVKDDE